MKILLSIFLVLVFAYSASADIYKWVDEKGVVNFTDDFGQVPSNYQNKVEKLSVPKKGPSTPSQASPGRMPAGAPAGETMRKAPPIAQTLVREGDFAIRLAEALRIGRVESDAEAESLLASAGIMPRNGWIADYPVTPDIMKELQEAIAVAVDSGSLSMNKNDAIAALQDLAVQQGLLVQPEADGRHAGIEPTGDYGDYLNPGVINDYYYSLGPPVITYYPPPPDYSYLYAWVPSRFWCGGFFFPGFFVLHDFHRVVSVNKHAAVISNHFKDHRTGGVFTVDPAQRQHQGSAEAVDTGRRRGLDSMEAKDGARAIFERSLERTVSGHPSKVAAIAGAGEANRRGPASYRLGYKPGGQGDNREGRLANLNRQEGDRGRSPAAGRRVSEIQGEAGHGTADGTYGRPGGGIHGQHATSFQRPSTGEVRSFSPPAYDGEGPFLQTPRGGDQHFSSSPSGGRSFSGERQGPGGGAGFRPGGSRF